MPTPERCWWIETSYTQESDAEARGEEAAANPGAYGRELAEALAGQLSAPWEVAGVHCEDWGWYIEVHRDGCEYNVQCGNENGSTTRWGVFIVPRPGLLASLRRKAEIARVADELDRAIESALRRDPNLVSIGRSQ